MWTPAGIPSCSRSADAPGAGRETTSGRALGGSAPLLSDGFSEFSRRHAVRISAPTKIPRTRSRLRIGSSLTGGSRCRLKLAFVFLLDLQLGSMVGPACQQVRDVVTRDLAQGRFDLRLLLGVGMRVHVD